MATVQLSFTLRTTANAKSVHLVGTWDSYKGQLPLSKDKESGKAGAWKGTFKFQGATLKHGQRYWYYYIIDGYHVSHDPARPSTTEPTTGRKLNILEVPSKSTEAPAAKSTTSRAEKRSSKNVAHGRALSPERIAHPKPQRPAETKNFRNAAGVAELTRQFAATDLSSDDSGSDFEESDNESDCPSLSSAGSSACSSPELKSPSTFSRASSVSSSGSACSCDRFGITRKGDRVRLDCGGKRCGGDDSSECCSGSEDDAEAYKVKDTRRNGVVVRHARRHARA